MLDVQLNIPFENAALINKAYLQCIHDAVVPYALHAFPSFTQIYDEYASIIIEDKTKRNRQTLSIDLQNLSDEDFNVEYGFQPQEFGIKNIPELFHFLMASHITFEHDNEVLHCPLQEVW